MYANLLHIKRAINSLNSTSYLIFIGINSIILAY